MNLEKIYTKNKWKVIIPLAIVILAVIISIGYAALNPYFEDQKLREEWVFNPQKKTNVEKLEQAENRLRESKKSENKNDEFAAYNDIALLRYSLSDYEGAIRYWEKALELSPDNSLVYCNIGNAYKFLKDYKSAEEMYKKSISVSNIPDKNTHNNLAELYETKKDYAEANKHYLEIIKNFNGQYKNAYLSLIENYIILKDKDNAWKYYIEFQKAGGENIEILKKLEKM